MVIIGFGANIPGEFGSPEKTLQAAVNALGEIEDIEVFDVSSVWHSAPVPVSDQPWYANAVCTIKTYILPAELLKILKEIEKKFGRTQQERNAPRVLDLDIIAYEKIITLKDPIIPHPRMHERAFVLYPLQEIAPDWKHPALEIPLEELIASLPEGQEIRKGDKLSVPLKIAQNAASR